MTLYETCYQPYFWKIMISEPVSLSHPKLDKNCAEWGKRRVSGWAGSGGVGSKPEKNLHNLTLQECHIAQLSEPPFT